MLRQAESTISVFQNNREGSKLNSLAAAEKSSADKVMGTPLSKPMLLCLFFFIATALVYGTSPIDGPSVLSLPAFALSKAA